MAFLQGADFNPSGDNVLDVLSGGSVWNLSQTTTISWALSDGLNEEAWPDRAAAIDHFTAALESIAQFINVTFEYVGDFASPSAAATAGADLVYSIDTTDEPSDSLAYAYLPQAPTTISQQYDTEGGDIFMNLSHPILASSSFAPGSDGFHTVIHEIGHALGLKHPFESEFGFPTIDVLDQDIYRDLDWVTMMSYTDQYEAELEKWDPATPMVLDVITLQYLYGINTQNNAGDTTFTLQERDYHYSLWDPSGSDRVDASQLSEGWTILLPEFQPTQAVDTLAGLAIASTEYKEKIVEAAPTEIVWLLGDIEHATGTGFADLIVGNALANNILGGGGNDELEGKAGDDMLNGNGGIDTAYYNGAQRSYTLTLSESGTTLTDRRTEDSTGTDTLRNIELVEFYQEGGTETVRLDRVDGSAGLSAEDLSTFIELYIAYFNRAPDAFGLSFWGTAFANGTTLQQMATLFIDQTETMAAYPEGMSNEAFATAVYGNVLGRVADQGGYDFWVNALNSNRVERDQFILEVLAGAKADPSADATPEFIQQQQADQAYLANKTDIGTYFAVHLGMSNTDNASEVMARFDGTQSGLSDAVALSDQFYASALSATEGEFLMPLVGVLENPFEAIA